MEKITLDETERRGSKRKWPEQCLMEKITLNERRGSKRKCPKQCLMEKITLNERRGSKRKCPKQCLIEKITLDERRRSKRKWPEQCLEDVKLCKLQVSSVKLETTKETLKTHFEQWGEVVDCSTIERDPLYYLRKTGLGYVTYRSPHMADKALAVRTHIVDGRKLQVVRAKPNDLTPLVFKRIDEVTSNDHQLSKIELFYENKRLKEEIATLSSTIETMLTSRDEFWSSYSDQILKNKELSIDLLKQKKLYRDLKSEATAAAVEFRRDIVEKLEQHLTCSICTEILIKPAVLGCSHSFCHFCIRRWRSDRDDCPLCRKRVESETLVPAVDEFIDRTLETLAPLHMDKRKELAKDRLATNLDSRTYSAQSPLTQAVWNAIVAAGDWDALNDSGVLGMLLSVNNRSSDTSEENGVST